MDIDIDVDMDVDMDIDSNIEGPGQLMRAVLRVGELPY